ncbi:MAG: LUD domain-containing protein [Nitrospirota bacterium]
MNFDEILALRKAFRSVKERQNKNIPAGFDEKKKKLKAVRESSVGNEELLNKAVEKLEKNGIRVFPARDAEEAIASILREIGSEKLVVKSKSNVTKEIELGAALESDGIEVIETDIGDRILQVLRCKPSHPTGPAAHLSAKQIAEGLSKFYGRKISENPDEIVSFVKDEIKTYIEKSRVGITGANAITAEEGSIVLAHNEGNIYQVMRRRKQIVVTGVDKVYPNLEDAINMLKIICFNATGSLIPSFVEIISGMSKTADVEKRFFKGVHSPEEVVLILLDNRRREIINKGFREILYCIDCGNCLLHCPMYNTVGNYFASGKNLGGKGLAYSYLSDEEIRKKLELCLTCGRCMKSCPLGIDVPSIVRKLRGDKLPAEIYYFLKSHLLWLFYSIRLKLH